MQVSATPPTDRDPDQQSAARARGPASILPIVRGVVRQTRLVGHKRLPGEVSGIDSVVDCIPLVHAVSLAALALLGSSLRMSASTPAHTPSALGTILQHF